jgi:hypothetical protein
MPVTVDDETPLVLASALTLRTDWIRPLISGGMEAETGPWRDKDLAGLHRTTSLLNRVGVTDTAAGPLTELQIIGTHGIDVHLYLGTPEATAGQVLTAAVGTLHNRRTMVPGDHLPYGTPGPGLSVTRVPSVDGANPPSTCPPSRSPSAPTTTYSINPTCSAYAPRWTPRKDTSPAWTPSRLPSRPPRRQ